MRRELTLEKQGGWARGHSGPHFLNLFSASFLTVLVSHFLLLLENVSRLPISYEIQAGDSLAIRGLPPSYSTQPHIWQEAQISCVISWCSPGWDRYQRSSEAALSPPLA